MKKLVGIVLCCCIMVLGAANTAISNVNNLGDILDEISTALKNGNSKEISKHFASSVSMTFISDEGVYSKVQAEIILRDFFNKNAPSGVKITNRIESNPNFKFIVLQLVTSKDDFKVSYKLVSDGNSFKISELKVEKFN